MRMMLKASVPVEAGNAGIKDGRLSVITTEAMNRLRPEAAYFFVEGGRRTALMVFDLADPSDIPGIVEPLFASLHAAITLTPVMNAEDMRKALQKLAS